MDCEDIGPGLQVIHRIGQGVFREGNGFCGVVGQGCQAHRIARGTRHVHPQHLGAINPGDKSIIDQRSESEGAHFGDVLHDEGSTQEERPVEILHAADLGAARKNVAIPEGGWSRRELSLLELDGAPRRDRS